VPVLISLVSVALRFSRIYFTEDGRSVYAVRRKGD